VSQDENPGEPAAAGERAVPTEAAVSEATVSEDVVSQTASEEVVAGEAAAASDAPVASGVASALRELETLPERELAEHPDVYQRIHAELQAALATIDNA